MPRAIQSGVYFFAAFLQLWPVLMLAMSTAFGGVDGQSTSFLAELSGEIACMGLLAIGGSASLANRNIPRPLLLSGPFLGCVMVAWLGFGPFRHSSMMLLLPQAIFSVAALIVGISAPRLRTN